MQRALNPRGQSGSGAPRARFAWLGQFGPLPLRDCRHRPRNDVAKRDSAKTTAAAVNNGRRVDHAGLLRAALWRAPTIIGGLNADFSYRPDRQPFDWSANATELVPWA